MSVNHSTAVAHRKGEAAISCLLPCCALCGLYESEHEVKGYEGNGGENIMMRQLGHEIEDEGFTRRYNAMHCERSRPNNPP